MTAGRDEIAAFCDELLDASSFDDYGPNGRQVSGVNEVSAIASGVSANLEMIEQAIAGGAELVLVHHGLLWGERLERLTKPLSRRLRALLSADVSLLAYHLPLDAHPEIGNNALLRGHLGLSADNRPFAAAKGAPIGAIGRADEPLSITELEDRLRRATGHEPLVFDSGPDEIRTVGVVTGGGSFALDEASALGLDALVTGEPTEQSMAESREYEIHFLAGGHHATETFGVRTLGDQIAERFGVEHRFIDVPNPV